MGMEKAEALVVRGADWSESSRVVTLFTRELGKVRALAKGGRRLRSGFESALDLLTHCSIVLLRKSSGSLDLLTEAQVAECFPHLRGSLPALYAGYYVAELLEQGTQDSDPHPALFDEALATLRRLGGDPAELGWQTLRFEMIWLDELGFRPTLDHCAVCTGPVPEGAPLFSCSGGGLVCAACRRQTHDHRPLTPQALAGLRRLDRERQRPEGAGPAVYRELRQVLAHYVTYLLGRRPRVLPYLLGPAGRGDP